MERRSNEFRLLCQNTCAIDVQLTVIVCCIGNILLANIFSRRKYKVDDSIKSGELARYEYFTHFSRNGWIFNILFEAHQSHQGIYAN